MQNLRTLIATMLFVLLVGALSACIVETRPDRSMVIYVPPPVAQASGKADLTVQYGTIPGTIPQPVAPTLMAVAQRLLTDTNVLTQTPPLSATVPLSGTAVPTATVTPTGTLPITATSIPTTTAGTALPTAPGTMTVTVSPTQSGTRVMTPLPTSQTPTTPRAPTTATATPTRTPTATGQATATATHQATATGTRQATATPSTPVATATPIPRTVFIGRNQGFMAAASYYVVGEVLNGDAYPVFNVKVIGSFYDSGNNLVAAEETTAVFPQIEPELSSPFKLQVTNSAGNIDHYELTLTWDDVSVVDYEELTIERAEADKEVGKIAGELRNEGSVSVQDMVAVVTLYDEENNVVNVIMGAVDKSILGTNETASYEITLPPDTAFDRFEVQAQGVLKLY